MIGHDHLLLVATEPEVLMDKQEFHDFVMARFKRHCRETMDAEAETLSLDERLAVMRQVLDEVEGFDNFVTGR